MQNRWSTAVHTPPTAEPVSLVDAKKHCGVELGETYWNDLLNDLIGTARQFVEERAHVSLMPQTLKIYLPRFPRGAQPQPLPRGPIRSLGSVAYIDPEGQAQTLAGVQLSAGHHPAFILPAVGEVWPSTSPAVPNPVTITAAAGYVDADSVPRQARQLILLLVGHWWKNREAVLTGTISKEIELAAEALFRQIAPGDGYFDYTPAAEAVADCD